MNAEAKDKTVEPRADVIEKAAWDIGLAMHRRRYNLTFDEALAEVTPKYELTATEQAEIRRLRTKGK